MFSYLNLLSNRREIPAPALPRRAVRLARALRRKRHELAARLLEPLKAWEKFAHVFQQTVAERDTYLKLEMYVFIDYLERFFSTGDETYKFLYIAEKLKQLHFGKWTPEQEHANSLRVTEEDIDILCSKVRDEAGDMETGLLESLLREVQRVVTQRGVKELKVLLIGDCLFLDVRGFLTPLLLEDGISIRPTFIANKNPVEQRNELRRLATEHFDLIFYSPFTYEFAPELSAFHGWRKSLASPGTIRQELGAVMNELDQTIDVLTGLFDVPTYMHNTANIRRHDSTLGDLARTVVSRRSRRIGRHEVNHRIAELIRTRRAAEANLVLFDEVELLEQHGELALGRLLYASPIQHPAEFGRLVAHGYRDILAAYTSLFGKKVVVADLDNTLWKGEIGEGKVEHFVEGQRTLKELRRKGVLLAVNSKNDAKNVHWDGAELGQDDFVHMEINWEPKAANMLRIQTSLNLKLKDFVFVDDRADQRLLVKEAIPEMHVLDATSPRAWKQLALWASNLPDNPEADRTQQYRERDRRESFLATTVQEDPATAFARLDLRAEIREAQSTELKRVTELINRTNQFNLAGSRTSLKAIRAWHSDPARRILVTEASDRFGPMGLICVALLDVSAGELRIHTFVLSCRVFGYGIENAVINAIKRMAASESRESALPIRGEYRETPQNEPCRRMYPDNGFTWEAGSWMSHQPEPMTDPAWLTITNRLPGQSTAPVSSSRQHQ
jgi:FkbH-like protein